MFQEQRGWNKFIGALRFLALLVGIVFGSVFNVCNQRYYYNPRLERNGGKAVPEARLLPMMVGGWFFAGGLFIIAWTGQKGIPWVEPCSGAVLMGFGYYT